MPKRPVGKRSVSDGGIHVRGKASNGEGSVYFAKDGRWHATYRVPGEGRPRTVSARTRELVIVARQRKLAELAETADSPLSLPISTSVGDLARWWLHSVQKHQVRASTWSQAEDRVDKIVATIGSTEVRKLRVEHSPVRHSWPTRTRQPPPPADNDALPMHERAPSRPRPRPSGLALDTHAARRHPAPPADGKA